MAISFFFQDTRLRLPERKRLKEFILSLFKHHGRKLKSLTYVFCTDKYLLEINRKFLNHDHYTDIITFNLSDSKLTIEGEIYISVDRVKENAGVLGASINEELHRVMFHGVLHLCGLKDKGNKDKKIMRLEEDKNLKLYLGRCSTGNIFQGERSTGNIDK
jgi:probable rRNA maturation factor